jgi:hypothetical protein
MRISAPRIEALHIMVTSFVPCLLKFPLRFGPFLALRFGPFLPFGLSLSKPARTHPALRT